MARNEEMSGIKGRNILTTFSVISCIQTLAVYLYVFFLTRYSTEVEYAAYMSIVYIVDFTVAISLFGFNLLIIREKDGFVSENIASILLISILLSVVVLVGYCVLLSKCNIAECLYSLLLIALQYLYQLGMCLQIKYKQNKAAFINAITCILFVCASLGALLYTNRLNCVNVLHVRLIQLTIFAFICYFSLAKYIFPIKWISWKRIKNNLLLALPIGGGAIMGVVNSYIDKLLLATLSVTEIAHYSVARFEIPFIGILTANLSLVLIPYIKDAYDNRQYSEARGHISNLFKYGWFLNVIVFTVLFCNAELIITTLYSEKYLDSVNLFRIIQCVYLLKIVPYTNLIISLNLERTIVPRLFVEMILQIVTSLLFMYLWGIYGLAVSLVLVLIIWSVPYNVYFIKKTVKGALMDILPLKDMAIFFVKCFIPSWIVTIALRDVVGLYSILIIISLLIIATCWLELKHIYNYTR